MREGHCQVINRFQITVTGWAPPRCIEQTPTCSLARHRPQAVKTLAPRVGDAPAKTPQLRWTAGPGVRLGAAHPRRRLACSSAENRVHSTGVIVGRRSTSSLHISSHHSSRALLASFYPLRVATCDRMCLDFTTPSCSLDSFPA